MSVDFATAGRVAFVADPVDFSVRCARLYELLVEANRHVNLTRITKPEDFLVKHVVDSLLLGQACPEIREKPFRLLDVGCGAGFPSLVLALAYPQLQVTALDSVGKKTAFVESARDALAVGNLQVLTGRSRELACRREFQAKYDLVTARAVAEALTIYRDARKMCKARGRFYFYKTPEQIETELAEIRRGASGRNWRAGKVFELPDEAGRRQFIYG